MAIVYLTTGEERHIDDALLTELKFEPLKKKQLRDQIASLRDQLTSFPSQTNAELVAWAEINNPQYLAREQIKDQIDRMVLELQAWP